MSQESALGQLMRMVGHVPQPIPSASSNMNGKHAQSNGIARPQPARLPNGTPVALNGLKPEVGQKRKAPAPLPMNPTPPDPRLLFPAAMGGMSPMMPGMPQINGMNLPNGPKLPNGMPMPMNPQFLPPHLAAQMMMNPMMPTTIATAQPQLPPELLALAAQLAACGGNPMDAFTLMQNPAMLAKLYADYAQYLQMQQQQQFHSLIAQQQAQALQNTKKRSTPTVHTPTAIDPSKMNPLASLQNMVNPQTTPAQRSPPTIKTETATTNPPVVIQEAPKDEVVIVDDEEKKAKTPISSTPLPSKASSAGPAFSIAEILQNAAEAAERPLLSTPTTASTIPTTADSVSSVSSAADVSNVDSQLSDATDSLSGQSTHSKTNFVKKAAVSGVNKCAQRKKHIEFHRKMKGINARCKWAQCQQCGGVVPNNSSELTYHIYGHAKKALFGCVNCDQRFNQKADLFRHSTIDHPKVKDHDQFHDFRQMDYLCELLEKCFPRNSKLVVDTLLNRLLKACDGIDTLHCKVCDKEIPSNFNSLKNHLTQHPRYRCKLCHFTCDDELAQIRHGDEHRTSDESPNEPPAALYNVTSAATILSHVLTECFGSYMLPDQLEFAEEMSAMDRAQDSPES